MHGRGSDHGFVHSDIPSSPIRSRRQPDAVSTANADLYPVAQRDRFPLRDADGITLRVPNALRR